MRIFTIKNYNKELTAAMRVSPIGFILAAAAVMSDAQNTVKKRGSPRVVTGKKERTQQNWKKRTDTPFILL